MLLGGRNSHRVHDLQQHGTQLRKSIEATGEVGLGLAEWSVACRQLTDRHPRALRELRLDTLQRLSEVQSPDRHFEEPVLLWFELDIDSYS